MITQGTWQFMSASSLQAPSKEIVVEDELESFFHVLLFFAIRFLHHNCNEVANFMHAYFDDYSMLNTGRYGCGSFKMLCMTDGCISLDIEDDGTVKTLLEFSWPPPAKPAADAASSTSTDSLPDTVAPTSAKSPSDAVAPVSEKPLPDAVERVYPLNHIIKTILGWIQAHYSLMARPNPDAHKVATAPPDDPNIDRHELAFAGGIQQDEDEADLDSRPPSPSTLEARKVLAQKLHTHHALLRLFEVALTGDPKKHIEMPTWPLADKTEDQLPKEGYKHGADVKANTTELLKQEAQRPRWRLRRRSVSEAWVRPSRAARGAGVAEAFEVGDTQVYSCSEAAPHLSSSSQGYVRPRPRQWVPSALLRVAP